MHFKCNQKIDSFILFKLMKNFRGSALAAGVGTPESVPHELLGSSLRFYLVFKHRDFVFTFLHVCSGTDGSEMQ